MRLVCVLGLGLLFCARISGLATSHGFESRPQTCLGQAIGDAHESRT
jgi:hypothetical protein